MLFMYHNLLDCATKTLDFTKNFIYLTEPVKSKIA